MKTVKVLLLGIEHCKPCEILIKAFDELSASPTFQEIEVEVLTWRTEADFVKHNLYPRTFPTVLLKKNDVVRSGWQPSVEQPSKDNLFKFVNNVLEEAVILSFESIVEKKVTIEAKSSDQSFTSKV